MRAVGLPEDPVVSVVIPMLNELGFIEQCLKGFEAQTYPLDRLEIVVVDGGSTDGSRELVERWAVERPWIKVLENPDRRASAAFNRGVESARGDIICLFSAHGLPNPDYVAASVRVLRETGASGVGGRYLHIGLDRRSRAIGLAMVSPFGMASPHRYAAERRDVDTISHPAYRSDALEDVGPFDETLLRNSDYELNHRMTERGHRLVFDPGVESIYRPRASLRALGRQFWWYGRWKWRVAAKHPGSLKARHLVPPAVVVLAASTPLLLLRPGGRRLVILGVGTYGAMLIAAVMRTEPRRHDADPAVLAAAFPVMHAFWGAGFLASLIEDALRR